jgi:hypothetical protein
MDAKVLDPQEEEMTEETKQNSATLAEWEDDFEEQPRRVSRNRRRNRRDSSLFTPSPELSFQDDDDSNDDIANHDQKDKLLKAPSTSLVVMENLASLQMASSEDSSSGSPPTVQLSSASSTPSSIASASDRAIWPQSRGVVETDQSFDTSHSAGSNSSDESTVLSSPIQAVPDTAELVVDLQSINAQGGAMDTTPPGLWPAKDTKQDQAKVETTPPQPNVNLDAIHRFGGALEDQSNGNPLQSSPVALAQEASVSMFLSLPDLGNSARRFLNSYKMTNHVYNITRQVGSSRAY